MLAEDWEHVQSEDGCEAVEPTEPKALAFNFGWPLSFSPSVWPAGTPTKRLETAEEEHQKCSQAAAPRGA